MLESATLGETLIWIGRMGALLALILLALLTIQAWRWVASSLHPPKPT